MGATFAIAGFELRQRLARISTYVYFVALAAFGAIWMAAAGGAIAQANVVFSTDKVFINSPYALAASITILGFMGIVIAAAVMGRAVQQDFEHETFTFFFTSPIHRRDYLLGRYLGAAGVLAFIFSGVALGLVIGSHWPGVEPSRVGPWSAAALLAPYAVFVVPNLLVLGACFFGLAALARRMMPVYVAGVVVLMGYIVAVGLLRDIDNRTVAALVDPLGTVAMQVVTRYWSVAEKNTRLVPLADEVLWNRALWIAIGAAAFGLCYARFRMAYAVRERRGRHAAEPAAAAAAPRPAGTLPHAVAEGGARPFLREFPGLVALYVRETVKNVYFAVIVLAGALFMFANARVLGTIYGTTTYPVTYQVLDIASGAFGLFMLIVTAFVGGELVWRERDARVAGITDALPTPTWVPFLAKLATLFIVQALLQAVVMVCGVLVQLSSGYTHLELGQYVHRLFFIQLPDYWFLAVLALTIHAVVNHKYLGHFLMVGFYVVAAAAPALGFEHVLYRFGDVPRVVYSDMNGYGNLLGPVRWLQLYWAAASVLLLVVARLAWMRGTDSGLRARLQVARGRWGAALAATTAASVLVLAATGAWIFYNTNVRNAYRNEFARDALRAEYEKRYKPLAAIPQTRVVASRVALDLFPHEHRMRVGGVYTLENKGAAPVTQLLLNVAEVAQVRKLEASAGLRLEEARPELDVRRYALEHALAPGDRMTLAFDLEYPDRGFSNAGASTLVVDNGTFVNNFYQPTVGYIEQKELVEDQKRAKHGLAPRPRMHDLDDAAARGRNYITGEGDWIDFEATLTTSADQVAIAPGYLQREWTEAGRRHFQYRMDAPILDFYAFLSARYAVKRGAWHGPQGDVPLEIYYQPGHEYNLERMMAGMQDALDYCARNFSPYQHKQLRILEFPRYQAFAQSFPNTVPFSEAIGFIARVKPGDPKDIDYPYYVTAHEVAHQWWAHQVVGANVQGATMLSETLAQYSALMVMKHKYGDAKMKRFLKYELDAYLVGRGAERKVEKPLYRVENQPYIHYRKGSVAMYELQDTIGEEAVDRALAAFVRKYAFRGPPYPTTRELLAEIRAVTPPEHQGLVADLFENITLYENRALSATARPLGDGRYAVTLKVAARKLRADESGRQEEVAMDDWVDIGVLGAEDTPLSLKKRRVKGGESTYEIEVAGKPVRAGIDPIVKLVDRRPDDNTVAVSIGP